MININKYNEELTRRIDNNEIKLNDTKTSFNFLTNKRLLNFMFADFETTNQEKYKELIKLYNNAEKPALRKKILEEIKTEDFKSEVYSWGLSFRMPTQKKNNKYYINTAKIPYFLKEERENIYYEDDIVDNIIIRTYIGHCIETFLDFVFSLPFEYKPICYFHNGGKFDFKYITEELDKRNWFKVQDFNLTLENEPWLIYERGRQLKLKLSNIKLENIENWEFDLDWVKKKWNYLLDNEYRTTEKSLLNLYTISTRYIDFWDSAKIYKMSLKAMGETLNNNLLTKGGIDYNAIENKFKSIEDLLINGKDIVKYQKKDCLIGFVFMGRQIAAMEKMRVRVKATAASTAYNAWLNIFTNNYIKDCLDNGEIEQKHLGFKKGNSYKFKGEDYSWVSYKKLKDLVRYAFFPTDLISDEINYLRNWYRGGINQFNPDYQGILLKDIKVSDINSSYPSVMYSELFFPVGQPLDKHLYNRKKHTYLIKFTMKKNKKMKEGYVPFIPEFKEKNSFGSAKYIDTLKKGEFYYLCEPEFIYFKKAFNIKKEDYIEDDFICFKKEKGSVLFGDFMAKFYDLKIEAGLSKNEVFKEAAKIFLNGLYGKFGSKWQGNVSYIDEEGNILEGQVVDMQQYYLPLGIFITAYARLKLVKAGEGKWKYIIYMDTDSIYYFASCDMNLLLDNYKLGWWDEKYIKYMVVSRTKTYAFFINDWKAKMGGIFIRPEDFKISMIVEGYIFNNQLTNDRKFSLLFKGRLLTENSKELLPIDKVKHKSIIKSKKIRVKNKREMIKNMIQLGIYD